MTRAADPDLIILGFLWVAETHLGCVGGLLVTNHFGRPLEFQCTTPVRPNRTQEILYGETLKSFLYGELIGATLCSRLAVKPDVLIVGQSELLELRRACDIPIAFLPESGSRDLPDSHRVQMGNQSVIFHSDFQDDGELLASKIGSISHTADLSEPLLRVQEALQETVKSNAVA